MKSPRADSGYALLLVLLILLGAGGVVLAGFTQQVKLDAETQRYEHNKRVLQQAKQALLMYAYRYPDIAAVGGSIRGPGRLPCPDRDNNGTPDPVFPSTDCLVDFGSGPVEVVGRFPWAANGMQFYDARDAEGERLWYAVSSTFTYDDTDIINSSARDQGTITLFDQSGRMIYDGSVDGIAAVIIAPGMPLKRDENGDGSYEYFQDRPADENDPRNYLDTFGGFDNSSFVNGSIADPDGFVLGPVFDIASGEIVVNDQFIIVTADEIVDMAEKKVLETYRDAIDEYLAFTGNVYPWLYNYDTVTNAVGIRSDFPADSNFSGVEQPTYLNPGNIGRIPSIFRKYFTETNSQPIESRLRGSLTMNYPASPLIPVSTSVGNMYFNGGSNTLPFQTADKLTNLRFEDTADVVGSDGRLIGSLAASQSFSQDFYFWDDDSSPGAETGVWTQCLDDGDGVPELSDCHRRADGSLDPGGPNDNREEILRVVLTLTFNTTVAFDFNYDTPPTISLGAAADGNRHARIDATFAGASLISFPTLTATFEYDNHYHEGWSETFSPSSSGTLNTADLIPASLTLGMRFYPELPYWVVDNQWHDSVMMAYAGVYRPDMPPATCNPGTNCLQIRNTGSPTDNKASLLVIGDGGGADWVDNGLTGLTDDLNEVFDTDNDDLDESFDARAPGGNDKLLVIRDI